MSSLPAVFAAHNLRWPLTWDPYRGQTDFLEKIAKPVRAVELVNLPTGYGKTICQIMYAALMIRTGRVRHIVLLVPKDNLRSSMVEEWQRHFPEMVPGVKILNAVRDMYSIKGYAEKEDHLLVVATYQQINDVLAEFCQSYDCAVIADEAHHLYDEGAWARDTASLESDHKMYFTATRFRGDGRPLRDVPLNESGRMDPLIDVSIRRAQDEKALCKVRAVGTQFWLDVEAEDGVYRVTTNDLEAERSDFTVFEARRQLRYADGFTTPLVEKALIIHNRKHAAHPYKHQMLWKAMSAKHADYLCNQINAIVGDDDFAHAVHIHKPADEVDSLLCRFRGVRREGGKEVPIPDDQRFPCLVQVDMAAEGYNNPYISTLVKADLTKGAPYITQLIGRALRINYDLPREPQQTIDVVVPDDDEATIELIKADFLVEPAPFLEGRERSSQERDIMILDIPDVMVLEAGFIKLYELNGNASEAEDAEAITWADNQIPGWRRFLTVSQIRSAYMTAGGYSSSKRPRDENLSESAKREKWRDFCSQAATTLTGNVIRIMSNHPLRYNGNEVAGRVKAEINRQWTRLGGTKTSEARAEELEKKHEWLKTVNDRVKERDIPLWLEDAYHGRK